MPNHRKSFLRSPVVTRTFLDIRVQQGLRVHKSIEFHKKQKISLNLNSYDFELRVSHYQGIGSMNKEYFFILSFI